MWHSVFVGVEGGVPRASWVHFVLANTVVRIRTPEGRRRVTQSSSLCRWGRRRFLPRGFVGSSVIQLAICLFQIHVFETDASAIRNLMSGTYGTRSYAVCTILQW